MPVFLVAKSSLEASIAAEQLYWTNPEAFFYEPALLVTRHSGFLQTLARAYNVERVPEALVQGASEGLAKAWYTNEVREKMANLRRLEVQRNELNSKDLLPKGAALGAEVGDRASVQSL